jgi:transposase-like protein
MTKVEPEPALAPTACPFCRSTEISTSGEKDREKVSASAYWRCQACGEMWNVARLRTPSNRYRDNSRW